MQLHPGDLGWHWRFGPEATAAAVRTWSRDGQILAVGLLDSPGLLRLAIAPEAQDDEELAQQMVADVTQPERGVLPQGNVYIEARFGALFEGLLFDDGWDADEPWTPLQRDLAEPVEDCGVRIEVTGPEQARVRAAVQRAAFDGSTFTDERWHAMAAGSPYADAQCLIACDDQDTEVAAVDGVVGRSGEARVARTDGRAPRTSRSRLRHGDHRRRGGRPPGTGLVERDRVRRELQRRRRRHLQVGRLPTTP